LWRPGAPIVDAANPKAPDRELIWGRRNRSASCANRREFGEETAMLRFVVALGLCCMAVATTASYQSAKAANDLSLCLDTWTTLDAGGPVSDEVLAAAQNACARLQQSPQDRKTLEKINKAVEVIAGEVQRRQAAPH